MGNFKKDPGLLSGLTQLTQIDKQIVILRVFETQFHYPTIGVEPFLFLLSATRLLPISEMVLILFRNLRIFFYLHKSVYTLPDNLEHLRARYDSRLSSTERKP
jgi:hypothetical protein